MILNAVLQLFHVQRHGKFNDVERYSYVIHTLFVYLVSFLTFFVALFDIKESEVR